MGLGFSGQGSMGLGLSVDPCIHPRVYIYTYIYIHI